jgi:hypothetical protein
MKYYVLWTGLVSELRERERGRERDRWMDGWRGREREEWGWLRPTHMGFRSQEIERNFVCQAKLSRS